MEIKPGGLGGLHIPPVTDDRRETGDARRASAAKPAMTELQDSSGALKVISTQYQRADLQDASKVNGMVSLCADELVESGVNRTGAKLTDDQKATLSNWMQNDPIVRGKIMNCVEQVLK